LVPLERKAQLVRGSYTPKFSQMISWKYTHLSAGAVSEDMELNHGRKMSTKLVQSIGEAVGELVMENEFDMLYALPEFEDVISHIAISRDGTTTRIRDEGYRETMCGTLSFYNAKGDRLHTIYTACAPEYGKKTFEEVLNMEIERVKVAFPRVTYLGLADGSKDNWTYLQKHTTIEILDFFHATEYLADVSLVVKKTEPQQKEWLKNACHDLKHQAKGARFILRELKSLRQSISGNIPDVLAKTITYFENNIYRMNYAQYQKKGYPIGSGVTEAACKVVVKQRLNQSGMKWNMPAVQNILLLRGIVCTKGRWTQFWKHYDKIAA
jgi:hypothetical protein